MTGNNGDGSIEFGGEFRKLLPLPLAPPLCPLPLEDEPPTSYGVGGELITDDTDEADDNSGVSGITPPPNAPVDKSNNDGSVCAMR